MANYVLYGDGIHDDTLAIQELIDSGACEIDLPAPKCCYLISKPLVIPSNFKLKLPRFAHIKLMDGSNCFMICNKTVHKPAKRLRDDFGEFERELWWYCNELSIDKEDACSNFEIEGGIWDSNNMNQDKNPIQTQIFDDRHFVGHTMLFYNAQNFRLSNMTLKDPTNFAISLDAATDFTIENITFDFNLGNPYAVNMDGIHINGNCHNGVIRNLKGACYDDLVALNAHEGSGGDITNISIDGIFAENCHSAVRLLTVHDKIEHIRISNVYGTYYQYCIAFTKYYPGEPTGYFDAITLEDIHVSKSKRSPEQEMHMWDKNYQFPLIWVQDGQYVKHLAINHLHRREKEVACETICIGENAVVDRLIVNDFSVESNVEGACPELVNNGTIDRLISDSLSSQDIEGNGIINKF